MEDQGSGKFYRDNQISPAPSGDKQWSVPLL